MKKILILLLSICVSLTGCTKNNPNELSKSKNILYQNENKDNIINGEIQDFKDNLLYVVLEDNSVIKVIINEDTFYDYNLQKGNKISITYKGEIENGVIQNSISIVRLATFL